MSLLLILMEQQSPSINFIYQFLYKLNALITNGSAMSPILYCFYVMPLFCNYMLLTFIYSKPHLTLM